MRVINTIQKKNTRNGKRKYTIAKAEISEMAILPSAITIAMTRLTHSMWPTGA